LFLAAPAAADITSNLEAWYKFDEGTGTSTTADSTANAHTATLVNSPSWVTGKIGPFAVSLNGTTQALTVPDHANFTFNSAGQDTAFSLALWIFMQNVAATQGVLAKYTDAAPEWIVWTTGSRLVAQLYQSTSALIGRSAALTTGAYQSQWVCIVVTYSGSETNAGLAIYANGARVDTTDEGSGTYTGMVDTATGLEFGRFQGGNFFAGTMDEVRIYRRALTSGDVSEYCAYTGVAVTTRRRPLVY
jgi:hypothetical protein